MHALRAATCVFGAAGTVVAVAMTGVSNLLDAWWVLSGVFAGGMLGLFLLSIFGRRTRRPDAVIAVVVGVLTILWMTLSPELPEGYAFRNALHAQMTTVVGTLVIFGVGVAVARVRDSLSRR